MTMSSITTYSRYNSTQRLVSIFNYFYRGIRANLKKKKKKILGTLIDEICFRLLIQTSKYLLRNQSGR